MTLTTEPTPRLEQTSRRSIRLSAPLGAKRRMPARLVGFLAGIRRLFVLWRKGSSSLLNRARRKAMWELIGVGLGCLGIGVTVGIAVWQQRESSRTTNLIRDLPRQL